MVPLIFSRLAVRVKKIRNGRAMHGDGFAKNILQNLTQRFSLPGVELNP